MTIFNVIMPAAIAISALIGLRRQRRSGQSRSEFWAGFVVGLGTAMLMNALIVDLPAAIRRGQFVWVDPYQLVGIVAGVATVIILIVVGKWRKWDQR